MNILQLSQVSESGITMLDLFLLLILLLFWLALLFYFDSERYIKGYIKRSNQRIIEYETKIKWKEMKKQEKENKK